MLPRSLKGVGCKSNLMEVWFSAVDDRSGSSFFQGNESLIHSPFLILNLWQQFFLVTVFACLWLLGEIETPWYFKLPVSNAFSTFVFFSAGPRKKRWLYKLDNITKSPCFLLQEMKTYCSRRTMKSLSAWWDAITWWQIECTCTYLPH